ncbi:T9SS-dependent choice-of-anchor J family protein [Hymenobacter weizhouensis]|uniref:T9SS-dependent choice-of-anchor J family protein n=1 Tax=Hymenobacter sp. YIM 151500-1 TaxID=2987689 RepID=UPI002225DD1F|nr:choice-of-anchor J domain-containing protein [Hymenobacter sp. YIM 151500-1]UYZ63669.1 choice-of-anchor J domain-containing protein [Hymenobacter sp. YIM 151500-1]
MKNSTRLWPTLPALLAALGLSTGAAAQATLQNSPYVETFDAIGTALPTGFTVRTGASATALGTEATLTATATPWSNTAGRFSNYASADGLTDAADATAQAASTDRALGVRQTGSFGDPGAAFVFQAANTTGKTDFKLEFKLQSLDKASVRTTTWQVDYATGAAPTAFQIIGSGTTLGGSTFANNPITVDFGSRLNNSTDPVWIRIVALTASSGSGSRPTTAIDDFSLSWQTPAPAAPALTVPSAALAFNGQAINTTSAAQSYQLSAVNLTADVTVTAPASFTVSKDNTTFSQTITFTPAELASAKTVYVRFAPTAVGPASGNITHATTGATTQNVAVSGSGFDPANRLFDFDNCTTGLPDGWTQFSVQGAQVWGCTPFGRDAADASGKTNKPNGLQMNGFVSGTGNLANEDWLISPAFNTAAFTIPLLSYYSRTAFNGAQLQLKVSTNYSGTGSPTAAGVTWTDVYGAFPAQGSDTWTLTDNVNLSAFKGTTMYVAFVYSSSATESARWTLDDIRLRDASAAPAPTVAAAPGLVIFGYQAENTSGTRIINASLRNLTGDVTISTNGGAFQVSKDGTTFSNSITYTPAEANNSAKPVTVRFRPTIANSTFAGVLTVATAGATSATVNLSGNSYNASATLEVVNWNIEWFGGTGTNQGPNDEDKQQANVKSVLAALNADVFALSEVVDTVRLGRVVRELGGYRYSVSTAASGGASNFGTAQKLAFVYRPSVVRNPTFSVLLECPGQATTCDAYEAWASGRFPYAMEADVTLNGNTSRVAFVLIHGKANTAPLLESYDRRKKGAELLKAKLDADYGNKNVIILGDFNDDLDQTITAGIASRESTYKNFVDDAANYRALTLPLSQSGQRSTASFGDMIDHVVVSNELAPSYIPNSAEVLTAVAATVADYANTTSDHYPIQTRFTPGTVTGTSKAGRLAQRLVVQPNPVHGALRLELPTQAGELTLHVTATDGRVVFVGQGRAEQVNQQLNQRLGSFGAGLYLVRATSATSTYTGRFVKD